MSMKTSSKPALLNASCPLLAARPTTVSPDLTVAMKPIILFRSYFIIALLCSFTLALPRICCGQNNFFLRVDGVAGESQDAVHVNEIVAIGFSFAMQNGSGARPVFEDLSVSKNLDKASPPLM